MTTTNFEQEFSDLLKADIIIPEIKKTFFDVAGFHYYEETISNFYAYYFNPLENHGLSDLMISALNKLICKKTKSICIENYHDIIVEREVRTKNGKYIDIVIREKSINQEGNKNLIIIENKIYAKLYNDFKEYFNYEDAQTRKIGIILSLEVYKELPENFINITHQEIISTIIHESGSYFFNAEPKALIIFKEFIQNLMNMTKTSDLSNQYDFFLKNEEKIRKIIQLRELVVQDVIKQINEACEQLQMQLHLDSKGSSSLRYYYSVKAPIYFTIWFEDLFNENDSLGIYIELDSSSMMYLDEINNIEFDADEKQILIETTLIRKNYIHYAGKDCEVDEENFKNIREFIINEISNSPLKTIFQKIENRLIELKAAW